MILPRPCLCRDRASNQCNFPATPVTQRQCLIRSATDDPGINIRTGNSSAHVQQAEDRLARLEVIVADMERANLPIGVERRQLVDTSRESLRLARARLEHLEKGASNLWWEREQPPEAVVI